MDIRFLRSFFANPLRMGAAFPSSPALAGQITNLIDFARARVIVELGPGTGAFTRLLAQRAHPACRVLALELDTDLATYVAARYPRVEVINAAAQRLPEVLAERCIGHVDAVVCGLPFANFSALQQAAVVNAVRAALRPGGAFVSYSFVHAQVLPTSRRFRRSLRERFGRLDIHPVLLNAPPALVYSCVA
ncbi:class I SAM-dependent methyltransferase [Immundisolibacter sp.]